MQVVLDAGKALCVVALGCHDVTGLEQAYRPHQDYDRGGMTVSPSRRGPTKRDLLVDTALELFSTQGFHSTGIDQITETAGVAKMTLYNAFSSKGELLLAAMERLDLTFREALEDRVRLAGTDPTARLLAIFDVLEDLIHEPNFSGCFFVNISAEFGDRGHEVHRTAAAHKQAVRDFLAGLAAEAGALDVEDLAEQLMTLFDGTIVAAHLGGPQGIGATRRAAKSLVEAGRRP